MSRVAIRRPHALTADDVRARVAKIATKITERFGATCRWDGDVLRIAHRDVNGSVTLEPDAVNVEVRLSLALGLFRSRAEQEITRILDRELQA
jgi:putative polyhydroxyalkanoate system protein